LKRFLLLGKGRNAVKKSGELGGARTHDPRLKRALLYQLSYELFYDRLFQIITGAAKLPLFLLAPVSAQGPERSVLGLPDGVK
jgi:hypothetical protein